MIGSLLFEDLDQIDLTGPAVWHAWREFSQEEDSEMIQEIFSNFKEEQLETLGEYRRLLSEAQRSPTRQEIVSRFRGDLSHAVDR